MTIDGNAKGKRTSVAWLKTVARYSSWLLLVSVVVLVLSGWGITQTGVIYRLTGGLIDRRTANVIHSAVVLPLVFFFLLHVFINIGLGIKSKHTYVKPLYYGLALAVSAGILAVVTYMEFFRLGG